MSEIHVAGETMKAASILALGALLCVEPAPLLAQNIAPEPALGDPLPDRAITFANGVRVLADVTYSVLPGFRPLILDLYRAEATAGPRPLVIYVHGGGWLGGHTRQSGAFSDFPAVLADLADKGYVVASLEYRLSGEAPFPAAIQDVKAAIRFLRANAQRYGVDGSRVAIWGGSAGGHLAALAATSCGVASLDLPNKADGQQSDCVQGAVGWYGIYDFASLPTLGSGDSSAPPADRAFLDCVSITCPAARVAAASPISHVDAKDPRMLLIHGAEDKVVPVAQTKLMEQRLRAAGVPVQAIVIPNVGHSWVGATPAGTRDASLRALRATFAFFDQTLKPSR